MALAEIKNTIENLTSDIEQVKDDIEEIKGQCQDIKEGIGGDSGSVDAQIESGCASIGGKDSMSGSYNELDVPPTLASFCIGVVDTNKVVSNEFKKADSKEWTNLLRKAYDILKIY